MIDLNIVYHDLQEVGDFLLEEKGEGREVGRESEEEDNDDGVEGEGEDELGSEGEEEVEDKEEDDGVEGEGEHEMGSERDEEEGVGDGVEGEGEVEDEREEIESEQEIGDDVGEEIERKWKREMEGEGGGVESKDSSDADDDIKDIMMGSDVEEDIEDVMLGSEEDLETEQESDDSDDTRNISSKPQGELVTVRDNIPDEEFQKMLYNQGHTQDLLNGSRDITVKSGDSMTRSCDGVVGPTALILAPTRELAMQIKAHLTAVAKHTSIKVVSL